MGQEFELKYRTTPEIQEAIQNAFPGNYTIYRMETTYFDTPDGDLSARRWTLRCRRENDIHICTLKTPGQGNARGEWDTESGDIFAAVPVLAGLASLPELEALAGLQAPDVPVPAATLTPVPAATPTPAPDKIPGMQPGFGLTR